MSSKAAVLEKMKQNGVNCRLQAIYVTELAQAIQESDIESMKKIKPLNEEKKYLIANSIIINFLNSRKFDQTLESISIESKDFKEKSIKSPEKELKLQANGKLIKQLINSNTKTQKDQSHTELRKQLTNRLQQINDEDEKPEKKEEPLKETPKEQKKPVEPVIEVKTDESDSFDFEIEDTTKPAPKQPQQQASKDNNKDSQKPPEKPAPKAEVSNSKPAPQVITEESTSNISDPLEESKPVDLKPAKNDNIRPPQKTESISSGMNFSFDESDNSVEVPTKVQPKGAKGQASNKSDDESSGVLELSDEPSIPVQTSTKSRDIPAAKQPVVNKIEESTTDDFGADLDFSSEQPQDKPAPKPAAKPAPQKSAIEDTSSMNFDFDISDDDEDEKPTNTKADPPKAKTSAAAPAPAKPVAAPANKNPAAKSNSSDIDVSLDESDFDL